MLFRSEWQYRNGSIRNTRWHLVTIDGGTKPAWQLFDLTKDYGETTDVAASNPTVVAELAAAYDQWWRSARPLMVNEGVTGPKLNPFKALYWEQFGGGPSPEELRKMDPASRIEGEAAPKKNRKKAARLLAEHARRAGDPNLGGVNKIKIVTAYRQEAIRIAAALASGGPQSPKTLKAACEAPRAGSILRDNHYGWFERQEKGIYVITEIGRADLVKFQTSR